MRHFSRLAIPLFATTFPALADMIVTSAEDSGSGTLRSILASATENETIRFSASLSGRTIFLTSAELLIDKPVTIDSSDLTNEITIDGIDAFRIFQISAEGSATIKGLTLQNGSADLGGAILAFGDLTLDDCTVTNNSSSAGAGAIYVSSGICLLTKSTFSDNSSGRNGGSIFNDTLMTIEDCTISNNSALRSGGGIYNDGELTVNRSLISSNTAELEGGGIYNEKRIFFINSTATLNTATDGGGAIFNDDSLRLINATVLENNVSGEEAMGTEIHSFSDTVRLINSIVISTEEEVIFGRSPDVKGSLIAGDPQLGPLQDNGGLTQSRAPLTGSPAIDMGVVTGNQGLLDQNGNRRISGGGLDIGAVENQDFANNLLPTFNADSDNDGTIDGIEIALGRDPNTPDRFSFRRFRLRDLQENPHLTFGYTDAYRNDMIIRIVKSTTLDDFSEILATDEEVALTAVNGIVTINLGEVDLTNSQQQVFYRMEVTLR